MVGSKLNVRQQWRPTISWAVWTQSNKVIISTLIRAYLKYCILFQAPKTGKTLINWSEISRGPLACSEGWSTCLVRRSCRRWTYSVWKRDGLGGGRGKGAHRIPQHLQGSDWGVGARLFTAVHSRKMELKEEWCRTDKETLSPGGTGLDRGTGSQQGCASSTLGDCQALTGHSSKHPGLSSELALPNGEAELETSCPPFPPVSSWDPTALVQH